MLQSDRFYEPTSSLNRFFSSLPHAVFCSDDKTARRKLVKSAALNFPYIQVNSANLRNWLVFDLDHNNPNIWEDVDLPPPNFIVTSRNQSNSSHLYYAIPGVTTSTNGRASPIAYMKAVYEAMAIKLNADLAYSGPVAKTPGHRWWRTVELHNHEYDLGELSEYVDLTTKPMWSKGPDLDSVSHSRNCTLFEMTRFYAYAKVAEARRKTTLPQFEQQIRNYATLKNRFHELGWSENLSEADIKATAKSIARWTWDKYKGNGIHRGVMGLDSTLPLKERQQRAAKRTADIKRKNTLANVVNTIRTLKQDAVPITLTNIAKLSNLTRQTVAQYKDEALKEVTSGHKLVSLFTHANDVKLGHYQIDKNFLGILGHPFDRKFNVDLNIGFVRASIGLAKPPDYVSASYGSRQRVDGACVRLTRTVKLSYKQVKPKVYSRFVLKGSL